MLDLGQAIGKNVITRASQQGKPTAQKGVTMYQIGKVGSYTVTRYNSETVKVTFHDLRLVGEFRPLVIVHRNYAHAEVRAQYLVNQGRATTTLGAR